MTFGMWNVRRSERLSKIGPRSLEMTRREDVEIRVGHVGVAHELKLFV